MILHRKFMQSPVFCKEAGRLYEKNRKAEYIIYVIPEYFLPGGCRHPALLLPVP